jgi:hypothetical protein
MKTQLEQTEIDLRKWNLKVELMWMQRDLRDLKKELDPSLLWRAEELQKKINELKERISNIS